MRQTRPICWVIEMKPKTEDIADENSFSKRIVWGGQKAPFTTRYLERK